MSSPQRRVARRAEYEAQLRSEDAERSRKARLPMIERIAESDATDDVKAILHIMAEKLGILW